MEDNALTFDNIFQVGESEEDVTSPEKREKTSEEISEFNDIINITTEGGLIPSESVSSEGSKSVEKEGTPSEGVSPNSKIFSSIANTLKEEGVLSNLSDDDIKEVTSAETLVKMFDKHITSALDEKQRRINEALEANLEATQIRAYENTLQNLDNISDDILEAETEQGEGLRRNLIKQDFLNRNFSAERAAREAQKSVDAGTDIEDAREALKSNKEFFTATYKGLIEQGKEEERLRREEINKRAELLKKSITESDEIFGIKVDDNLKKKIYNNLSTASFKAPDGNYYTAIQKAEKDDPVGFMHKLGTLFTLTDGFKNIDKLIGKQVEKKKKESIKNLEEVLTQNPGLSGGNLSFVGDKSNGKNSIDFDSISLL